MSPSGARLAIIGAAVLWSTGGTAVKLTQLGAAEVAGGRAIAACLTLFLVFPQARLKPNARILWTALSYAGVCTLFVFANKLTTAGAAIFLQNIAPVWVLLIGPLLLNERASRSEKLSVPIAILGCSLFFVGSEPGGQLLGNGLALAASICYGSLILSYRYVSSEQGLAGTIYGNLIIAVVILPFSEGLQGAGTIDWMVLLYLGAIQQGVSAVLFIKGIRQTSALEGALLILFEPILSPIFAYLILAEEISIMALFGGLLIIGSAVYRALADRGRSRA